MGNKSSSNRTSAAPKPQAHKRSSSTTVGSPAQPLQRPKTCDQQRITLVTGQNLSSQQGSNTTTTEQQERCYDPGDTTLTFVNGEDDMDFECKEYKSRKAKMSCGHTVTPTSLMNWCQRLLDRGETRFVCGVCDAEWPREEVYKMALMTPEEIDQFDKELFKSVSNLLGAKTCPGCKSYVVRESLNDLRVLCTKCTTDKGRDYDFCWQCLKEWKRPSPYSDRCAEDDCYNQQLEILRTCKEINFEDVRNVTGCPSVRACPTCGFLIEHSREECKNITCSQCKVEFCFVCLKPTPECLKLEPGSYFSACLGGVAPRQTIITLRKQN